jgi:hypothetical protein
MRSLLATLLLSLALAAPAVAQGPAQDGYISDGPQAIEKTRSSGDRDPSSLPFTGMDLGLVGGLGLGLLVVGAGMRRLTRPAGPAGSGATSA